MVVHDAGGAVRFIGCAPLYKVPQSSWTARLAVQMTLYTLFIGLSMAAGALMPWLLEIFYGWKLSAGNSLYAMYSSDQGYVYENSNSYPFCPKKLQHSYERLPRGYPAPPLSPQGGQLYDAWYHKKVVLKGVNWFGFNNKQGMVDGLWAGGSSAATDFQAVVYQLKLLGFNTVRLPFTFAQLKEVGLNQIQKCTSSTKADWAKRATDPELSPQPDYSSVPDPPISLHVLPKSRHLCNTYIPSNSTASIERLLWTIQYLVASGFYVVLDYHPDPADHLALEVEGFARAWVHTWAAITCLPNFSSDIRGRLILDLLNEPDKVGPTGIGWTRIRDTPGLDELYLSTMDTIENITPNDALYMLQGSMMSNTDTSRGNRLGLAPGDGFVTDSATISSYDLSDPRRFFNELLTRPYRSRVILAPHLYAPAVSGVPAAAPFEVAARVDSSWGVLATDGYCSSKECLRMPVVAGEMGSRLDTDDELSYYDAIAQYTQLGDGRDSTLSGWIWWAYNANSNVTGGLTTEDWQALQWPKIRYLREYFGLNPWYEDPAAFSENIQAKQEEALMTRSASDAAAASAAIAAKDTMTVDFGNLAVVKFSTADVVDRRANSAAATAQNTPSSPAAESVSAPRAPNATQAAAAAAAAKSDSAPLQPLPATSISRPAADTEAAAVAPRPAAPPAQAAALPRSMAALAAQAAAAAAEFLSRDRISARAQPMQATAVDAERQPAATADTLGPSLSAAAARSTEPPAARAAMQVAADEPATVVATPEYQQTAPAATRPTLTLPVDAAEVEQPSAVLEAASSTN